MPERVPSEAIDVSVVIPVYDAAPTLPHCLQSLLAQSLPRDRYEIIVVDNGSGDGSATLAEQTPGVTVLRESRQGAYAARNRGIRAARGEVVAFTDPDCVAEADWLERATKGLADGSLVVVGETLPDNGGRMLSLLASYNRARDEHLFGSTDPSRFYGRTNNMAVRRSVFDTVGPFVEVRRGGDTMLVRSVAARHGARSIRFDPRMRVHHAEIDGLRALLAKAHVYAYVSHTHDGGTAAPPLALAEWARVLRATSRRAGSRGSLLTLSALTLSLACAWRMGRWRAALRLGAPRGAFRGPRRPADHVGS